MDDYAGIDVSLECSSVCIVDANGKIIHEGKGASEPEALIDWLRSLNCELTHSEPKRMKFLKVLLVGALILIGGYLLLMQLYLLVAARWCEPPNFIESREQAIARAKQAAVEHDLFKFPELGGSRGFIKKLDEQVRCCGAKYGFQAGRTVPTWYVGFDITNLQPNYSGYVEIDGMRTSRGKWKNELVT